MGCTVRAYGQGRIMARGGPMLNLILGPFISHRLPRSGLKSWDSLALNAGSGCLVSTCQNITEISYLLDNLVIIKSAINGK